MKRYFHRIAGLVHRKGVRDAAFDVLYRKAINPTFRLFGTRAARAALERILHEHAKSPVLVLPSSIGWNHELFQRSQQMALSLAAEGFLYFYVVRPRWPEEVVQGFVEVQPRCFVTNRADLLLSLQRPIVIHLYSPDAVVPLAFLQDRQAKGDSVLYEYIDEVHEELMGPFPQAVRERHQTLLRDETVPCIASADRLLEHVLAARSRNYALVTNGVDLPHFSRLDAPDPPERMREILGRGKPVIGYYGAIAPWVDYHLLRAIAQTGRYAVCLIGPLFMLSGFEATGLAGVSDIHWIGSVPYRELPRYARFFSVATIPFLLNEITESTSPVKLFEYMALGKPIVTTDIRECRKYRSVVIGKDRDDFIAKLDGALRGDFDEDHYRFLGEEAARNSWAEKARQVASLLGSLDRQPGQRPS